MTTRRKGANRELLAQRSFPFFERTVTVLARQTRHDTQIQPPFPPLKKYRVASAAASRHRDPTASEAQHQTAGHAILCRVRVSGRGGAGLAPQHHEASHGFCMPAQRWKNTSITTKAWRHEHLNVTLFDETEMEHEEAAARTASVHQCHALFFRHDAGPKVRLHRADDAMMRPGQASLQPPRPWWQQQLSNESTED